MLGSSRTIPAFAVPQTEKSNLIRPPGARRVELPQIVPSIRIRLLGRWAELIRHNKQLGIWIPLDLIKTIGPVAARKSNRFLNKSGLVEGNTQFQFQPARKAGFGEKQIAPAGST